MTDIALNDFVTEKLLAASTGLTPGALEHYRRSGDCVESKHWMIARNGRIMWNRRKFNEWLQESRSEENESESGSSGAANGSMRRRRSERRLAV